MKNTIKELYNFMGYKIAPLSHLLDMLALALILLKFSGFLTWPWMVVLMPIWLPLLYFTFVYLVYRYSEYRDNKRFFGEKS